MARMIGSFRTAQYTPERVMRDAKLVGRASVNDLVNAAKAHDQTNPGYLSAAELRKGAADLNASLPQGGRQDGYRFNAGVLGRVQREVPKPNALGGFSADAIVDSAAAFDNGNGYLNKSELKAGALALQMIGSKGALSSSDIATIRQWTGAQGPGPAPSTTFDALDGGTRAEAIALLRTHGGGVSLDELEEAADEVIDNREGTRSAPFSYSVEKDGDALVVTLSTSFESFDHEDSHYTQFELSGGDWTITDAGT